MKIVAKYKKIETVFHGTKTVANFFNRGKLLPRKSMANSLENTMTRP